MNALGWLVLGLLAGWGIEFLIDFAYWRKKAQQAAEELASQEEALQSQHTELGHRKATMRMREREMSELQASLASRDAELLQAARRVEERSDDLTRLEQATEKRRAELDRMGLSLTEREKEIAQRTEQLRARESEYNRRLDTLDTTEKELARRVAVVANREEAMQSWEGRILNREHDVADREASVNYHATRIASDAAALEAARNLLASHFHHPDGRDNLQALEGIDAQTEKLLHDAGIDSFERLGETPLGELTRMLQSAGPRFGLVNPLSWAEQAVYVQDRDYVALDRVQAELRGVKRDSVKDALLSAMLKPEASAARQSTAKPAESAGQGATNFSEATAQHAAIAAGAVAAGAVAAGTVAASAVAGDTVAASEAAGDVSSADGAAEAQAESTAGAEGAADSESAEGAELVSADAVASAEAAAADRADAQVQTDAGEQHDALASGLNDGPASDAESHDPVQGRDQEGAVSGLDDQASSDSAEAAPVDAASGQFDAEAAIPIAEHQMPVWASDAGDEGEGSGIYGAASAVERVEAVVVEDAGDSQRWPRSESVSDAFVLSENHAEARESVADDVPMTANPMGSAH